MFARLTARTFASTTAPAAAAALAKRPLNGYMKFAAAKRAEVKATLPADAGVTGVAKALGGLWRALSAAEKEAWKTR